MMAVTISEMKLEYIFGMKINNFVKCWSCLSLFLDFFILLIDICTSFPYSLED